MLVMKFGGSSVANKAQIEKVRAIVESKRGEDIVVVCSAHKGITNLLVETATRAARGELDPDALITRQREIQASLGCPDDLLDPLFASIRDLLRGISLVRELSPRSLDFISSFGERMSVRCIADYMARNGVAAQAFDVWDLGFVTDNNFNEARPLPGFDQRVQAAFAEKVPKNVVPVVTGFVGKTPEGDVTTVGRNGSDLTASLLGAALGAREVEIWTDTDGVMTADPSVVAGARNIPTMRFDEAAELAYFGSRVLHPSTLLPAIERNIPVRVLNTNRPEHHGTVIMDAPRANPNPVTSIAYKEGQAVLTISSTGMFGQAGFLGQVFGTLGAHGIIIDMVSTSEVSVSVTTDNPAKLEPIMGQLEAFGAVSVERNKTILAVVGQNLSHQTGVGRSILGAMADAEVNLRMLSYGMGSINFTMVIDDADIARAVPVLHDTLLGGAAS